MTRQQSADLATMLAAIVVLVVGLMVVAFNRGCGADGVTVARSQAADQGVQGILML